MTDVTVCPYNNSHLVLKSRLQSHIVKCAKKYQTMSICVYNATHRVLKADMLDHLLICETKKKLENLTPVVRPSTGGCLSKIDTRNEDKIISNEYWE